MASELARRGVRVIVAGLDQDYLGKPFEPMPQLLAIAEYITKTRAICMVCGNPANHTQRLVNQLRSRAARRAGHLRSAVPALLRSDAVARRGDQGDQGSRRESAMSAAGACPCTSASPARTRCALRDRRPQGRRADSQLVAQAAAQAVVTWPGPKPPFYAINLADRRAARHPAVRHRLRRDQPAAARLGAAPSMFGVGDDVPLLRLPVAAVDAHPPRAVSATASGPTPASCVTPRSAG